MKATVELVMNMCDLGFFDDHDTVLVMKTTIVMMIEILMIVNMERL